MATRSKQLMGALSLIALMALSACSDEVENGGRTGTDNGRLGFAVSTGSTSGWNKADGSRSADGGVPTQAYAPVEMDGKVGGKTVYLSTEVTDGFPGDDRPQSRGMQITEANKAGQMTSFGVSAYTDKDGTPDYMKNEEVKLKEGYWYPHGEYYWPGIKKLSFYAWYPYTANGLTLTDSQKGAPVMYYEVPDDVTLQQDIMTATAIDQTRPATGQAVPLTFNHDLAAVKFAVGDDLSSCIVKSIKIAGVIYSGLRKLGSSGAWGLYAKEKKDFTLTLNKTVGSTADTPITADDQTLFMLPQDLPDSAKIEVVLNDGTSDFTVSASIGGTSWDMGKTYTYTISYPWKWEEPSRNLPAGKQLLTSAEHNLIYDFTTSNGERPIINGKGKFVITPIYADGTVCSSVAVTEQEFTITRDRKKVELSLDANPNYNLLRMIQIKVTNPDGTEKTLNTVDFQEAKTDANNIVIHPTLQIKTVNTKVNEHAVYTASLTGCTPSFKNELATCESAVATNGWTGIKNADNMDADKLKYMNGDARAGLGTSFPTKSCYADVTVRLNNWCLGYEDEDPNANYIPQYVTTSNLTNIDGRKTTGNRTDKDFNFTVDRIDVQKAGFVRQGTSWRLTNNHNSRYWAPVSSATIINGAKNIAYWGYMGCLDYWNGTKNSTQIRVCGYGSSTLSDSVIAWWLDHLHTYGCKARVIICYYDEPNSDKNSTQALEGRFYWGETYQINKVYWAVYRAAGGITENANANLNKQ